MVPTPSITHLGVAVPLGHPAVTQHLLLDDMKGTNHCAAGTAKALSTAEGPSRPPWATQLTWGEAALGCLLSNALPSYSSF